MNDYFINLTASKPQQIIYTEATGIWFVAGTSSTAENRIKIKFTNSDEFALKPGQSVIGLPKTGMVSITSYDGSSIIDGSIKLGTGKFEDSNIYSLTTLAPGGKVEALQAKYTSAYCTEAAVGAGSTQLLAAAANVNGAIFSDAELRLTGTGRVSFLAKATAPANALDGDVLLQHDYLGGASPYEKQLQHQVYVPAGKGIYYYTTGANSGQYRQAFITVL